MTTNYREYEEIRAAIGDEYEDIAAVAAEAAHAVSDDSEES